MSHKYEHIFDISFGVQSDKENSNDLEKHEIEPYLLNRVHTILNEESDTASFGYVDTIENFDINERLEKAVNFIRMYLEDGDCDLTVLGDALDEIENYRRENKS